MHSEFAHLSNAFANQIAGRRKNRQLINENAERPARAARGVVGREQKFRKPHIGKNFAVLVAEDAARLKVDEHDGAFLDEALSVEYRTKLSESEIDEGVLEQSQEAILRRSNEGLAVNKAHSAEFLKFQLCDWIGRESRERMVDRTSWIEKMAEIRNREVREAEGFEIPTRELEEHGLAVEIPFSP